jgi:hypothetical protein
VGSTDAANRAHGDDPGRTDGRGGTRPGDHADTEIDRRAEGRDVHEQEGGDPEAHRLEEDGLDEASRAQEHHSQVPEARRRGEEGRDRAEAQDVRSEGLEHPQAHDGAQEHHSQVPEARRRGEEGRDRAEAQDVGRSEGLEHPQAHRFAEDRVPTSSLAIGSDPAERWR